MKYFFKTNNMKVFCMLNLLRFCQSNPLQYITLFNQVFTTFRSSALILIVILTSIHFWYKILHLLPSFAIFFIMNGSNRNGPNTWKHPQDLEKRRSKSGCSYEIFRFCQKFPKVCKCVFELKKYKYRTKNNVFYLTQVQLLC